MNILHICSISNNKASGMSNVIPYHFIYQKKYENVALLNCNKTKIELLNNKTLLNIFLTFLIFCAFSVSDP